MISEVIYDYCNDDGNENFLLNSFVDSGNDKNYPSLKYQKVVYNGNTSINSSTCVWNICYQWKYGFTTWDNLSDLKDSHPVQMVNFSVAHEIER